MMSSIPDELTAALPFIFVTEDMHAISPAVMERDQPPAVGPLKKLYWSTHFEELKHEFFSVKAMGPATAEEWLKGLEGRGSERRNDASRWEKWATGSGSLSQMTDILYPGHHLPAYASTGEVLGRSAVRTTTNAHIPGLSSTRNSSRAATPAASSQRNGATPDPCRRSSSGTVSHSVGRPPERTKEEVADLKAARRAEIERRAFSLDPPLPANILAHIPSFQAALQIITPLDDQGWELLKPRLLAQRSEAEQREKESTARLQKELEEKRNQTAATKEARVAEDADWDDIQAPLRARIAGFADEIIRDGWEDGEKVSRDNCSKFAVEVLTYIRKRFYAEVAKDAAAACAAGKPPIVDPPQGPFTQKLTLENMKWIFEVKVKPHTEQYRKEIFLCNGCDVTVRYYGFEGVIQHYAAKHTNALSIGNVVVHWRAEWPEHPPFTSEQKSAKTGFYHNQPLPGYNKYQPGPPQPFQPPPTGPTPAYGPPSWSEAYPQGSQPPHPPAAAGGYAPPQGYGANSYQPADPFQPYPSAQSQQQGYNGPAQPSSAPPYNYNYGTYQSNSQVGYPSVQPPPFSHQYGAQLEEMARIARELWNATSNMKDTLSIVRVQVVVYHLAKRFHAKFGIPLPLSTFIDGLSNHKDMRPVRNVNGLICRVCHQGIGGYTASEEERKSWSLPQLTSHFQSKHVEPFVQMGQYGQPPEWTVDMVLLPEPAAVSNLRAFISTDGQKYHLVNEAVPHLLTTSNTPQAAANEPSGWHDHSNYLEGYQGASAEPPAQFYDQSHPGGPAQGGSTSQYQNVIGATVPYSHEPATSYNYTEPPAAGAASIPLAGAFAPTDPAAPAHGVALSRDDSNGGRSSQGHRQRLSKKNKKKGGSGRDSSDEEARKRKEEEEKMAEEEAERETDAIKAMWAADRANTAKKSVLTEGGKPGTPGQADKPRDSPNPSNPSSKPSTPQQRNRFQSKPPRNSPRRFERESPLRAPESRLSQVPPAQKDIAPRGHQLSNVTYMDGQQDEPPRRDWRQTPDRFSRHDQPPPPAIQRPRSRSPVYMEYSQRPPTDQYRQRTPPRRSGEPAYQHRPPVPVEDARYERQQHPRDDYVPRGYSEAGPAPSGDLIEYEIIEYQNPDGTVWVEERPLRRIPNSEAERYYRGVPPPAPAPYGRGAPLPPPPPGSYRPNEPPPLASASFDRGGPLPPGPYRREQLPPPTQAGEPYRPQYDRGYSRAPPPPPPPPAAGPEYYDPRYPSDVVGPRHHDLPVRPTDPPYYEEYDPRYPAGPPNMPAPGPPRAARY